MVAAMYGKNIHFNFIHFQDTTTFGAQKILKYIISLLTVQFKKKICTHCLFIFPKVLIPTAPDRFHARFDGCLVL